jgi:hypothetical protein
MLQDETKVERLESSIDTHARGWENMGYASFDSITQPECMLPAQFFARCTSARVEGEMRLLIAVLEDAINTYVRCMTPRNHRQREEMREVEAWFEGRGQSGLFAFENVCELLGVEAGRLREWVRSLRDSGPARARMTANDDRPKGGRRKWRIYLGDRGRATRGPSPRRPRIRTAAKAAVADVTRLPEPRDMLDPSTGCEPMPGGECGNSSRRGLLCASL